LPLGIPIAILTPGRINGPDTDQKRIIFYLVPWLYDYDASGSDYDFRELNTILDMLDPITRQLVWYRAVKNAVHLLRDPVIQRQIEALTDALLERETLSGQQACEILDRVTEDAQEPKHRIPIEDLVVKSQSQRRTIVTTLDFSPKLNGELSGSRIRTRGNGSMSL